MSKKIKKWLRILCWTAGSVLLLLVVSFLLLNTSYVQNKLKDIALDRLSEQLHTSISIDKVSVSFFSFDLKLHGLDIKDRQNRDMLHLKSLVADVNLWQLLSGEVKVSGIDLDGLEAHIYKSKTDSVLNCQFLIDALAQHKEEKENKNKVKLVINDVDAQDVYVTYNNNTFRINDIDVNLEDNQIMGVEANNVTATYNNKKFQLSSCDVDLDGKRVTKADLKDLKINWTRRDRKGNLVSQQAGLQTLKIKENGKAWDVDIEDVRFVTNNHRPRKNANNPKRGFFDPGHLDITANLKLTVHHASADSLKATIKHCVATDKVTGIDIHDLTCAVTATRHNIQVRNVKLQQGKGTKVSFAKGNIQLPNDGQGISYSTSPITVYAILQDISRPFAPVLKNFTMPLLVSAEMSGTNEQINISNAVVHTADNQFRVKASGTVIGFEHGEKHQLHVHFDVNNMLTNPVKVENIIKQFPIKRFMMKQLLEMGKISYAGSFDVFWKKEEFRGCLSTEAGDINVDFAIDGLEKILSGSVSTPSLEVGKLLGISKIGSAIVDANFTIDLSNEKAAVRNANKGKLPIGEASAHVSKASYGIISVSNVDVTVKSDGITAQGDLIAPHKFIDLSCSFSFTDTDDMSKLKIHPHMKVH